MNTDSKQEVFRVVRVFRGEYELGSAFKGDDVEEEGEAHQREEEDDVLRVDQAFGKRVEVRDETEIGKSVGEAAVAEKEQCGAGNEPKDEGDDLVFRDRRCQRADAEVTAGHQNRAEVSGEENAPVRLT